MICTWSAGVHWSYWLHVHPAGEHRLPAQYLVAVAADERDRDVGRAVVPQDRLSAILDAVTLGWNAETLFSVMAA